MSVFAFSAHPQTIHNELAEFLARHSHTVGAKALSVLLSQPGKVFDVLELSLAVDWGKANPEPLIDLLYYAWPDIPVCDAQALSAYQARLSQVEHLRAQLLDTDPATDCSELTWEIAFLRAEIRNSTKPRGGIKNFRQTRKRAYNRLRLALMRLLARASDPLLHRYLSQNLSTALGFVWLGETYTAFEEVKALPQAA